jgi:Zn-dependent oligopeptidase
LFSGAFAKAEFGVDELQPWDIAYYSEKQKQHLYSISDEQLRPYFPENKAGSLFSSYSSKKRTSGCHTSTSVRSLAVMP